MNALRFALLASLLVLVACSATIHGEADASDAGDGHTAVDLGTEPDLGSLPDVPTPPVDAAADSADVPTLEPFDPVIEASLQALIDEHVTFGAEPGTTLTLRTDDGRYWSGAAGHASLTEAIPMTPDTGFRVGSNTKPFIATLVLQLVDEGLVALDAPLTDYLPDYTVWSAVTVRHLLGMRSGIPDYLTNPQLMLDFVATPDQARTPEEILGYPAALPMDFAPGEDGAYCNTNYLLLGLVIEAATGRTVAQELADRLIGPLGLTNTFLDGTGEIFDDLARGYMDLALVGQLFGVPPEVLVFVPEENRVSGTIVDTTYLFHPSFTWSAGGIVSTAPDMVRFVRALAQGELLQPETLDEMTTVGDIELLGDRVAYGLGVQVRDSQWGTLIGHGGLNFGYQAGTYYVPELGVTLSHMHNYLPEQSYALQEAILGLLSEPPAEAIVACDEPEGFFHDYDDGPYVHVRFKGPVNPAGTLYPAPGIGMALERLETEEVPLYGWSALAQLHQAGFRNSLRVESVAPVGTGGVDARSATVDIATSTFTLLDEDGVYTLAAANPGAAFVTVSDVTMDPVTRRGTRLCFTAVSDLGRGGHLRVCEPKHFTPTAGAELRLFASLAVTTDEAEIESTLGMMGVPRCMCPDAAGEWGACP